MEQLELLLKHTLKREFDGSSDPFAPAKPSASQLWNGADSAENGADSEGAGVGLDVEQAMDLIREQAPKRVAREIERYREDKRRRRLVDGIGALQEWEAGEEDKVVAAAWDTAREEQAGAEAAVLADAAIAMVGQFSGRQAQLVSQWMKVGYVQGNMNSDNCLLGGRTLDYGPFGFIERYDPMWSPFTSDADKKFGFERQPLAAQVNLATLAKALLPAILQSTAVSVGIDTDRRERRRIAAEKEQGQDGRSGAEVEAEVDAAVQAAIKAAQEMRVNEVSQVVQQQYPQDLHRAMCAVRSAKLGLQQWRDPTEAWQAKQQQVQEEAATPQGQVKAKQREAILALSLFNELGLEDGADEGGGDTERLWRPLMELMRLTQADYTILFRELARGSFDGGMAGVADDGGANGGSGDSTTKHDLAPLVRALECGGAAATATVDEQSVLVEGWLDYLHPELQGCWKAWLGRWQQRVREDVEGGEGGGEGTSWQQRRRTMLGASPKYVPREWMLAQAYDAAEEGDLEGLLELQQIFADPYREALQNRHCTDLAMLAEERELEARYTSCTLR
jgi:uncharacterized protein YdiU (UPF0061 family)